MLQKKLAGNRQLSKHIWFGKKAAKTIAYRTTCYFFMLAPKRSGNQNHSLPFCCYFFMLAPKEAAIKTIASVLLVTFYALRQKKRQSKTIPYGSACYFFMLAPNEAAIKTIAYHSACSFFMLAPKEAVGFRVQGSPHIDKHSMQHQKSKNAQQERPTRTQSNECSTQHTLIKKKTKFS
jgi:hypothetical protein